MKMKNYKKIRIVLLVFSAIIMGHCASSPSKKEAGLNLHEIANVTNQNLPIQVDELTVLQRASVVGENILGYTFSIADNAPKEIFTQQFLDENIKPQAIESYRTTPKMEVFRKNNVIIKYIYEDSSGKEFGSFEVDPADF